MPVSIPMTVAFSTKEDLEAARARLIDDLLDRLTAAIHERRRATQGDISRWNSIYPNAPDAWREEFVSARWDRFLRETAAMDRERQAIIEAKAAVAAVQPIAICVDRGSTASPG